MVYVTGNSYWRPIDKPQLGLMNEVSNFIFRCHLGQQALLRDLRYCRKLTIVSDYGGEHGTATFATYSFLIFNEESIADFVKACIIFRDGPLGKKRRMAYKNLGDKVRKGILVPFLHAADTIHGILFTISVEKHEIDLFGSGVVEVEQSLLPNIKLSTTRKLLTICHFLAVLVSGTVAPFQDIAWLSDQDDIVANASHRDSLGHVFGHFLNHYLSCDVGRIVIGTTQNDPGTLLVEDLASIPDLSAGALSDVLTRKGIHDRKTVKPKARPIVGWLCNSTSALAKVNLVVRATDDKKPLLQLLTPQRAA